MAITQKEIANKLGVSRQLVNFAINGVGAVSDQTRREILEAASQMGYRRNELARAVVTGKSKMIGVVAIQDGGDNMFRNLAGALATAATHGYSTKVLLLPWDESPEAIQATMRRCSEWRLDGIIAINLREHMFGFIEQEMQGGAVPVVYLEEKPEPPGRFTCIGTDERAGIRLAIQHLIELGHRHISFLSGAPVGIMSRRRAQLFLESLSEFGLPINPDSVVMAAWERSDLIEEGIERLFKVSSPTAIMCAGDSIAMVTIHALSKRGLRVPQDISVIGFGDFRMAALASPPLTTLEQRFYEMGGIAVEKLLLQIGGAQALTEEGEVLLLPSLVVRESTAPPRLEIQSASC